MKTVKNIILLAIALAISTLTLGAHSQSNPIPPTQLVASVKQLATYLNHNYQVDPNNTNLDQNIYTDHNVWYLAWWGSNGSDFEVDYDLENNMLINLNDYITLRANETSKRTGATATVTATQARQTVQNLHQFLGIAGDWRSIDTFLSPPNGAWTVWYCKYSLFVNGYYSREENMIGDVNAYDGTMTGWVRREPRTYVAVTSPLLSFNQAQQIAINLAQRSVIVQEVRGLSTQTDPLWTVVDYDIQTTPVCRLAYVFEVVPAQGEGQSPKAIAIDAQTGESWLQMSALYTMGGPGNERKPPKMKIKSERFQMIDRLSREKPLAPLLRSIASGRPMKRVPKEKPISFAKTAGNSPIAFNLYRKSRTLSWTASAGKKAGVQLSKPEMALLQKWLVKEK